MSMFALSRRVFAHLKTCLLNCATLWKLLWQLRKEVNDMAMVYATLIIKGRRTFESVPEALKEQVREILIDCDCEHLLPEGHE